MNLQRYLERLGVRRLAWLCYALGLGAVAASAYGAHELLLVRVQLDREMIEQETYVMEDIGDRLPMVIEESSTLYDQGENARKELDDLNRRLPIGAEEANFLSQLTRLSNECGLEMADYRPSTMTNGAGLAELSATIALDGSYVGICRFLRQLDSIPRMIRTSGLQFRPSDGGRCTAELQLSVYYRTPGSTQPTLSNRQ